MALSGADIKKIRDIFAEMVLPSPDVELRMKAVERTADKLSNILCGNGEKGMDESVREIEHRIGVVESDMKEIKVMVQKMSGYQGVTYDDKTHPGRRAGDEAPKGSADKFLTYITERILPGLIQALIVAVVTAVFVLIVRGMPAP